MLYNYHTHSKFCDGSSMPEEYCNAALKAGMKHLGFSGHAPVNFNNKWSINDDELLDYFDAVKQCYGRFDGLKVFCALEADYIPGITSDFNIWRNMGLDYIVGSIHLVKAPGSKELCFIDGPEKQFFSDVKKLFNNDFKSLVRCFFEQTRNMVQTQKPDIIGHLDKIVMHNKNKHFDTSELWYVKEIEDTLEVLRANACILEVNTRGLYKLKSRDFFPSGDILKICHEMGIKTMISTDAHKPTELLMQSAEAINILKLSGYTHAMKRHEEDYGWEEYSL